jgi:membrane protein DedA with SNARE-associated domain
MQEWIDYLRVEAGWESLGLTFLASAMEYLVPPLPADTVVVASALLVLSGAWPFPAVYLCVIGGGLFGAWFQYSLGRCLADGTGGFRGQKMITRVFAHQGGPELAAAFRKHGFRLIAFNRFLPGLRAGVFLMAGALRLDFKRVMLLGLLSSMLWSGLLLGLGLVLGDNFENIYTFLSVYRYSVGGIMIAFIGVFAYRRWAART